MTETVAGRVFVRAYGIRRVEKPERTTVYETADGGKELRIGGTPAWRNNNPGNIRPSRNNKEQIGEAWGFAVFASREAGLRAIGSLLRRPFYAKLSLRDAIFKYAPPSDANPTDAYVRFIYVKTGIEPTTVLSSLDDKAMTRLVNAIAAFERSEAGVVTWVE